MIQLSNVTKKFGSFTAVNNISLSVGKGDFFGFLGANGAGKTTTIKMMTGLFTPTSGTIEINGYNIVTRPFRAKKVIGYVPDQPYLYDKLTGREFLYFVGGLYGIGNKILEKRIEILIEHFEIGDWVDKMAEEYSQGMRQRIGIAAAMVHDPKIIIVDEPMVGLDPQSARVVKDTLRDFVLSGRTVFMSTHSLNIVEELCNRIGIIKNGEIIYYGTIDKLDAFRDKSDGKFETVFLELTK